MVFDTPVVLIVFNRPEKTKEVFGRIRMIQPKVLHVISDGPRSNRVGESQIVNEVRSIAENVDWDCRFIRHYSEDNMGCRQRIFSGLNEVFRIEERAIILEDDCLPDLSFFRFCADLLEKYQDDSRIMHIGGSNFIGQKYSKPFSYHFSYYPHVWGWATWKRAWRLMDLSMASWEEKNKNFKRGKQSRKEVAYWTRILNKQFHEPEKGQSWAYSWLYSCWLHDGLSIYPRINLVQNTGLEGEGTHHHGDISVLRVNEGFIDSLHHPVSIEVNELADRMNFEIVFQSQQFSLMQRFISHVKIFIGRARRKFM